MPLHEAAKTCLAASTPEAKLAATFAATEAFRRGDLPIATDAPPPDPIAMPGRPPLPPILEYTTARSPSMNMSFTRPGNGVTESTRGRSASTMRSAPFNVRYT